MIYRSTKKPGSYLYLEKSKGLKAVPAPLLELFGKPVPTFTLMLTPEKKLAQVDVDNVIESIKTKGYFLQMPPQEDEYMKEINIHNSKL